MIYCKYHCTEWGYYLPIKVIRFILMTIRVSIFPKTSILVRCSDFPWDWY